MEEQTHQAPQATEAQHEAIEFRDVSRQLNIANSKLGYVMPRYKTESVSVDYPDMDYTKFNDYNKAMASLEREFDTLAQNAHQYKDSYINEKLAHIQHQAEIHSQLAQQELEEEYKRVVGAPRVTEEYELADTKVTNAMNRHTTVTLAQAVLNTGDVDMIQALLEDNIANQDVRLLARIKLQELLKASPDTQTRSKLNAVLVGMESFEHDLHNKSKLGQLERNYTFTKSGFQHAGDGWSPNRYVSRIVDMNNYKEGDTPFHLVDFSKEALQKRSRKARNKR